MADAVDYSQLTSALNNLTVSNTSLANTINNAFGASLTKSIEDALKSFSGNKNYLPVHDDFLSNRVFNNDWHIREKEKVDALKVIRTKIDSINWQTLQNNLNSLTQTVSSLSQNTTLTTISSTLNNSLSTLNDAVKDIGDSLKLLTGSNPSNPPGQANPAGNQNIVTQTLDFYKNTLAYLKKISDRRDNPVVNPTIALQGIIGSKLGNLFGGGPTGNALGGMIGQALSRQLQQALTEIFRGGSITKVLFGFLKGTVGRLLTPVAAAFKGLTGTIGLAAGAIIKLTGVVFGASAKIKDFFEKVTPMKMLLGIIPEAVSALTEFVNMIVMFPLNRIKETEQLAYSTMNSLTSKINDTMATYGVSQEQAMRMIYQQEVMLKQMPYIYRDSFKVQADITEQYRSLLKSTGMTVQQAQGLAPVLDKFKNSIIENVDLAGSTLVKLGSKLYGNLDHVVNAYGSTLVKLQNSMNINASQVNQQFQDNFAEYFELTTYNADEMIAKSTSMIEVLADLNSTVIDSNKLLQNIVANRDKTASEFFQSDFGRSVMMTSSNPMLAKMWIDSRDPENLKRFYEDRFAGIRRRLAGFTPETLNTEYAYTYLKATNIDIDEARQVLKQGSTAKDLQKFSEDKKADRWQEVLKTLAQDYHREWAKGHVFIGPDSKKLLQMGNTWGEEKFVSKWRDIINGNSTIGIHMDKVQQAATMLTVMDKFFGGDFTSKLLIFMGTSIKIANDIFATLVHFSSATIKFIGHLARGGFDVFNPESSAYQNMVKDVLPSVAMGLTATNRAAIHGTEAMGQFGKLMEDAFTKLTSSAQSLSKEYGLDPKNFSPDGRLGKLGKTLIDSFNMYSLKNGEYAGNNKYIEAEYKNRYAQLATASKSGPKAILASISNQLSNIICEAVSKALEGFPGYRTVRSVAKFEEGIVEQWARGSNYGAEVGAINSLLRARAYTLDPEKFKDSHDSTAYLIRYLGLYDPEGLRKILKSSSYEDTFGKGSVDQLIQRYTGSEETPQATRSAQKSPKTTPSGRMFTREEVVQMNPFGSPASEQTTGSVTQQSNSVQAVQQAQQAVANQAVNVQQSQKTLENTFEKRSKEWTYNYDRTIDATHSFRDQVMEGLAEQKVDIDNGFDILEETTISIAKNLIDIKDILAQVANPGIVHFNKFNNNLSTKLNRYLEGMIEFIDAEKKLQEEQKSKANSSDLDNAIGGGEFRGFEGGSVFNAPITGQYRENRGNHYHNGIDFGAPGGTPLPATEDAIVADLERNPALGGGYGKLVFLKGLKSGMYIGYAHLSEVNVNRIGQKVSAGEMIGRVGNTGHSFGDHLHFMVGTNVGFPASDINSTINPLDYLKGKNIKTVKGTSKGTRGVGVLSRLPGFGWLGNRRPLDSAILDILSLVANSESAGAIDAVRDAADRGYGKYQFTTLPGSFDNWGRFVTWLGNRQEFAVLYDKLKNTNGADASSVRPAIQELARTHHALFERAQDLHALEYWFKPLGGDVMRRSNPFKAAAFSFSIHRSPGWALDILKDSGALSTTDDRQALIKLYKYAYNHFGDFAGRYDKETKMLGIYDDIKISNPKGDGVERIPGGVLDNLTQPFTSYESGLNLASSLISGSDFDGLRPFITGPMYSGSWQVDNGGGNVYTSSQAGISHLNDYLSIWGDNKGAYSGTTGGSSIGKYSSGRASMGDNALYSMGWTGDKKYSNKWQEWGVFNAKKYGLTSSSDIAGVADNTNPFTQGLISNDDRNKWWSPSKLGEGLSLQRKGNTMVVIKTPPPPPAPVVNQRKEIQRQEMVNAMKTTAKAAVEGAKANQETAKAAKGMEKQMDSKSKNIGPTWADYQAGTSIYGELLQDTGHNIDAVRMGYKVNVNSMKINPN